MTDLERRAEEEVAKELGFKIQQQGQEGDKDYYILIDEERLPRPVEASWHERNLWLLSVRLMLYKLQVEEAKKEVQGYEQTPEAGVGGGREEGQKKQSGSPNI